MRSLHCHWDHDDGQASAVPQGNGSMALPKQGSMLMSMVCITTKSHAVWDTYLKPCWCSWAQAKLAPSLISHCTIQVVPAVMCEQESCPWRHEQRKVGGLTNSASPKPRSKDFSWPIPTSIPSMNSWSTLREESSGTRAAESPWHRPTAGYLRGLLMRVQYWRCSRI